MAGVARVGSLFARCANGDSLHVLRQETRHPRGGLARLSLLRGVGACMEWNEIKDGTFIEWAAADTEAYTLVCGERVSAAVLDMLAAEKSAAWWRENTTVHVYAWLITNGRETACFSTWEAFADFCAAHRVKTVWWYNAKYDFAHIDYAMLTGGWSLRDKGRLQDKQYRSLHGVQGQRYCLTVAREYKNANRHKYTHITRHYDLCNIFGGGLAKNLDAFNVVDFDGEPVRKLEMDYQGDTDENAVAYMRNDVVGLYHLVRTCDEFLTSKWGYTLTGGKPDVMTAGGLAKRVLLRYYNGGNTDHSENVKAFQRWHVVGLTEDRYYRTHHLYRGGITLVNKNHQNKPITRPIFKYDINSMYPHQMNTMPDLVDRPIGFTAEAWAAFPRKDDFCAVYLINHARGFMRDGMLPMYYDNKNREYSASICIDEWDTPCLYFADEWHELQQWYDVEFTIARVYAFRKAPAHGFRKFVADNYEMKRQGKVTKNKVMEAFAKLLLNSSYGKLSENPIKEVTHRELNENGAVTLIMDGEQEDEKCLLSVVDGALITSMARVQLMRLIREICPVPARDFVYCDTDSIAAFTQYANPDPYTLGALKDETEINGVPHPYTWAKYIAPKTYILCRYVDGKREIECHTKGLPLRAVMARISPDMTDEQIDAIFAAGVEFVALSAMNVRGGKALVPIKKFLCRTENTIIHGSQEHPETVEIMEEA